jgi:HSP20 family molecular chaperone IbpA
MLSDGGININQMEGLMELLGTHKDTQEYGAGAPNLLDPASLTGGSKSQAPPNMKVAVKKREKKDTTAIWEPQEFKAASGVIMKEQGDDREIPKYDILYKTQQSAEDSFLNLSDKDNSSDHCNSLLVKIELPGTQMKDISLEVLKDRLTLQAPKHRLNLALPYPVKKDEGNAKWDKLKGILSVTVPIDVRVKYVTKPEDALDQLN